jgi:hypothetical protein
MRPVSTVHLLKSFSLLCSLRPTAARPLFQQGQLLCNTKTRNRWSVMVLPMRIKFELTLNSAAAS